MFGMVEWIAAKRLYIIMRWFDDSVKGMVDDNTFCGMRRISTTDALVDMVHRWYEAADKLITCVHVVLLDFSKAFDLINHHILLEKLQTNGIQACIVRWIAAFLLDRLLRVKISTDWSFSGSPNGGVPQGTLSGPKCFLLYVNELETRVPLYKYVDDSTLFEICSGEDESVIQQSIEKAVKWTALN